MEQAVSRQGSRTDGKRRALPVRTCVGCRERDEVSGLRRAVLDPAGRLHLAEGPEKKKRPGRGAYVHPCEKCLIMAMVRGGFERSFRRRIASMPETATLVSRLV